jgi:glycerol uptake facilitator protein
MSNAIVREVVGEFVGTFLIVLFGCGAVAVAVLFGGHTSLFQVALVWAIAVALAIFVTRDLSGAHLNPAVSIALASLGKARWRDLPHFVGAQLLGAFAAAALLFAFFGPSIARHEAARGIVRGEAASIETARIFGEFYPNPGASGVAPITMGGAFLVEAFGTFLLMAGILRLTDHTTARPVDRDLVPFLIGLLVFSIICLIAPFTQAGLNPARDLAPRLFAALAGWGSAAFPPDRGGFLVVYVLGPIAGALCSAGLHAATRNPVSKGHSE